MIEIFLPSREVVLWSSTLFNDKPMKEFKSNEYKLFIKDIKELKSVTLTASAEIGKFVKIAETKEHAIYVYEHESHSSFLSMTFTKVASLTEVEENKNLLIDCTEHAHHDQFLPFFCGNDN